MSIADIARSHVRTVVPFIVGLVISLGLRAGYDLHGYAPELTVGAGWAYYAVARLLERYVHGNFGWLLGAPGTPVYSSKVKRLKTSGSMSHTTIAIHADTSQALAALKELEQQATKTAAAVKKTQARQGRKAKQA